MIFEEQFPSLVKYKKCIGSHNFTTFDKNWVQEHCFDKARVREVLEDCTSETQQRIIFERLGL